MSRLIDLPTGKYDRLREALEEMARRRPTNNLTVREAAQSLRLRQAEVLELAEHSDKLDLITAYRTGRHGPNRAPRRLPDSVPPRVEPHEHNQMNTARGASSPWPFFTPTEGSARRRT